MKNVSSSNSQEVNVPKLRFPGFMDDWSQQEMGSVACYNKKRTTVVKSHFISTENMRQNCNGIDTYYDSTIVEGIEFSENDILIANIRPYLKKAWKAEFSGACSTDVLPIKATGINADFLFHCIEKDDFFNYVMSAAKGSKMPRGDKQHIMEYTIPFPSEREQKKVSAFIGLLSQRITIQRELIEFLKLYKHRLFFLLLLHYIALRQLIPAELRQPSPFYIYSDTDLTYVADALLGIFGTNEIIPLSDTKGKIIKALSFAKGTSVFFNIPEYSYAYARRVGENTEYLNSLSDPKTTVIVLCRTYDRYTESAFNITLNKDDISKQYVNKSACGEHIRHFTDWISERSVDFSNNPSDNFLTLIFGLVSEYFTEIGVNPELENPCALIDELIDESSMDLTGAWVLEWFAESCLTLRSKGLLNIVDLSSNTGITDAGSSFDSNLPTVIKKDHLLCITESDLSLFIKLCDTNLSACIVKQSLLNMGALDRDKGRTYQKNIYIPQLNKAKRMLAIIYSLIFPSGHLGI